jgi:hypothetical protein
MDMDSGGASSQAVEAHLEKLLGSATFRGAERSRRLIRFIVEETLGGRADRLKDYTLGAEALGRGDGFDPRTDPIARVSSFPRVDTFLCSRCARLRQTRPPPHRLHRTPVSLLAGVNTPCVRGDGRQSGRRWPQPSWQPRRPGGLRLPRTGGQPAQKSGSS